jgi:hypothetical protein
MRNTLYERDFYAWANEQAALLRAGRLVEADLENVAEEIESIGRSEKRELTNRLKVLLTHLFQWRFQPAMRGNSWRLTIEEECLKVSHHMGDNPSLKDWLPEGLASAYRKAILVATIETGFDSETFPRACPWTYEQIMDAAFWPDDASEESTP